MERMGTSRCWKIRWVTDGSQKLMFRVLRTLLSVNTLPHRCAVGSLHLLFTRFPCRLAAKSHRYANGTQLLQLLFLVSTSSWIYRTKISNVF